MSPQERCLTRRQKKHHARPAVIAALRRRPASDFISTHDYSDVTDRLVGVIEEYRLAEVPVDEKDVCLALRYLHAEGILRVTHYSSTGEELHRISLLRRS